MCHTSAQIDNLSRAKTSTIYKLTHNDHAFFKNFNNTYKNRHIFSEICNMYNYGIIKIEICLMLSVNTEKFCLISK